MRLKSLQIKGFKSFANDTILNFNEDVIGIVGPNGSGKSNIVDAIRWVLGEQKSKELRLEAMSDIIFNGTKTKKEAPTATVALTFENNKGILPTEYQQVTISRTLYRSGESEYRLNNIICRLKDITSLLIDTGIGSNSYAIIALGMVDDILEDKDHSRRRMFEQAAGISKYKIRKRETLNKLKSATEDLARIDDLLFEIEGNLKNLERQAKRAQKYLDLKAEYKTLSINHAVYSVHHLKEKYKGISEQLLKLQDEYRANDTLLLQKQAQLEKGKKANLDQETVLSGQQRKLNDLVYQIRTRENEKGLLQQKHGFKKQNKEQFLKDITIAEDEHAKVILDIQQIEERLILENNNFIAVTAALEQTKNQFDQIRSQYNNAKINFDARQKEIQDLERNLFNIEKEIAISDNTSENHRKDIERIQFNLESKNKEFSHIRSRMDVLTQEVAAKEQRLNELVENETKRKTLIAETEAARDGLQEKLNEINRNLDSRQNEYDLLKSMIDNFEGFPESIRFLSEQWKNKLSLLSDIIDVQEPYKSAVELYLENMLSHFVAANIKEAIQGINLLKNAQKGKANFFILDQIPVLKPDIKSISGLVHALKVVHCDEKFQNLANHLLRNVYIYEGNIEEFGDFDQDITIISVHGTFLKQPYTLSGGSVGLFEGKKLGRKKNLEKLSKSIESLHKENASSTETLNSLKKKISDLKSEDYNNFIEKIKKEIQLIEQDKVRLQQQTITFEQLKAESESKIKQANLAIAEETTKKDKLKVSATQLGKRINELQEPTGENDQDIEALNLRLSQASEQYNASNIAHIRHQNLLSNFVKDKDFKVLKLTELTTNIAHTRERLMSVERDRIDIEDQLIVLEKELKDLYAEKKDFQSNLSEAEQDFLKARNEIHELEEVIKKVTRDQNQLQFTIQNLKDQFSEQKFQIQSIGERLRIEFQVSINDYINEPINLEEDYSQIEEELDKIKVKLHAYGDVNPLAVEAYNELKERYDTIQIQRKDILDAQTSLMDTMKEIEKTATEQFMSSFIAIRTNFIEVFRSLFTLDDTCDLILSDPSNPLESEIEIIARPKGKKPKSISQLSGGEKTLTATALLFALYLLKPAPFCIFDEVDAPLDDANIQKFNKIIQRFSKESQFIIVTHNKSTMAEVNILYGVYMSEPGVSAVSSVDFRSYDHTPVLESLN
ncbi:MAG: chromosome segregation protein SMC [Chitinophagales bacterium]|nr:chromosome segregation protein SMC [Chitinophagales bacterium]